MARSVESTTGDRPRCSPRPGWSGPLGTSSRRAVGRRARNPPARRAPSRGVLPGALAPRQGGALHPRGELHRVVLVAGLRQRRHHHLGDPGVDYPSVGPTPPSTSHGAAPGGVILVVHVLPGTRPLSLRARRALELWREARTRLGDPVAAWAEITADPERAGRYKRARGRGGFVRAPWPEGAGADRGGPRPHRRRLRTGPDRRIHGDPRDVDGLLRGGHALLLPTRRHILSFYDWYADLPIASPQVFGDQTDVPESADWWNASYLIVWGTNLPITRTPDAHS